MARILTVMIAMKKLLVVWLLGLMVLMSACNQSDDASQENAKQDNIASHNTVISKQSEALLGCYHLDKNEPALIYISQQDGQFFMQMKEPTGAWDMPERLVVIDKDKGWSFFLSNGLGVKQSDIVAVLARPDEVMAVAVVKAELSNINPQLDSHYLMTILGATNTVYQMACDDKPVGFGKSVGHSSTQAD